MIKGLLLTGGKSRRMGRDKARLVLRDGQSQTDRGLALLESVCDEVYRSVATGQSEAPNDLADLVDAGPLSGLHAAFQNDACCDWLVLACDLPLIEKELLSHLIRSHEGTATAYRNRVDSRAEPLCAIYGPTAKEAVEEWISTQSPCARHFLESLNPNLIELPEALAFSLDNANTPEDLIELQSHLDGTRTNKTVKLLHFAQLRDAIGESEQAYQSHSTTAAGIYDELRLIHKLELKRKHLRVAINGEFSPWDTKINDGDEIVFIPPVSGG